MTVTVDDDLTYEDLFCGAGGSISGMKEAGFKLVLGANHSARSIETAAYNNPEAEFLCTDINSYDMRKLPRAAVLWASVICTEISPAGGNKKMRGQGVLALEEQGHVPNDAYERTRACALDVIRATEVHRYTAVVVENVIEFARDWELYDWWIEGMCKLGYNVQTLNVSAAHVYDEDNAPAPQWRDRIYIVFTRTGVPLPNLEVRPPSWCATCDRVVEGCQVWKRPDRRRIGKYGQQYLYRCGTCSNVVEPFVAPAIDALDLHDIGQRIGDRAKPLGVKTMDRIIWGLENLAYPIIAAVAGNTYERPGYHRARSATDSPLNARQATGVDAVISPLMVNHGHDDARVYRADESPLPTRTLKIGDGVATVPFITMLRAHNNAVGIDVPLPTVCTGRHHYLTTPPGSFWVQHYGTDPKHCSKPVEYPLSPITTIDHHALVIPYRKGVRAKSVDEPLHTLHTKTSAGVLSPALDPMDCYYRTLKPREHARAQRFLDSYDIKGNVGEQTMQAGNAVPVNCAHFVGKRLLEALA